MTQGTAAWIAGKEAWIAGRSQPGLQGRWPWHTSTGSQPMPSMAAGRRLSRQQAQRLCSTGCELTCTSVRASCMNSISVLTAGKQSQSEAI